MSRLLFTLALACAACGGARSSQCAQPPPQDYAGPDCTFSFHGAVKKVTVTGTYYLIVSDAGVAYDPLNLAAADQQDGLAVQVTATVQSGVVSFMPGPFIEIESIALN